GVLRNKVPTSSVGVTRDGSIACHVRSEERRTTAPVYHSQRYCPPSGTPHLALELPGPERKATVPTVTTPSPMSAPSPTSQPFVLTCKLQLNVPLAIEFQFVWRRES